MSVAVSASTPTSTSATVWVYSLPPRIGIHVRFVAAKSSPTVAGLVRPSMDKFD